MKTKMISFRVKITVALIFVVAVVSFLTFYIFNQTLSRVIHKEHQNNILTTLEILKDQYYYVIGENDGKIITPFLKNAEDNKKVLNTYLINSGDSVIYPEQYTSLVLDSLSLGDTSVLNNDITLIAFESGENHFARAFIRMQNSAKCFECHDPDTKTLGYIVLDFSMAESEQSLAYVQGFSFIFTLILILVIIGLVIIMHYRFVRTSLIDFESTMNIINQGKLNERLVIPKSKELGVLAGNFNKMLDNFQKAQDEIKRFHQKELRNKRKLASIGEMAARLAHEIRNPITGIANSIEIIVSESKDDDNKPILEEIQRQANRVNDAITNLLKYSRNADIKMQRGNINEIITSLVFFLENQTHNKDIKIKLNLDENIPLAQMDVEQIENVLLNLGINAIQSIRLKGKISYATHFNQKNNLIEIAVKDDGVGIPDNIIQDIFEPFFTTRTEGTGLGLAIVKDIIQKHKGEIIAGNNKKGGAVFTIFLPVH